MISRKIKVEVRVISRSQSMSQKPNLIVLLYIERKKMEVMFLVLRWREATQSAGTWHDYPWPWVSFTWFLFLYNLQLWRHGRWFRKLTARFRPIRKELKSSMYNNNSNNNNNNRIYNKIVIGSIVITSPRAYLSRNRRAITWVSNCRCSIWTFSSRTPVIRYPRDFHVNYARFNGFLGNVFYSFQNLRKALRMFKIKKSS